MCAEYNKSDPPVGVDIGRAGSFPGMEVVCARQPAPDPVSVAAHSSHRQRESEEEYFKEECSSTESQHQEVQHTQHNNNTLHLRLIPKKFRMNYSFLNSIFFLNCKTKKLIETII